MSTSYTLPVTTIDPAFCVIDFTYTVPDLANGNSAITRTEQVFDFFYNTDLSPVTPTPQTLTVTVLATSDSLYTKANAASTVTKSFDLTFSNPCIDLTYVKLDPPAFSEQTYFVYAPAKVFSHPAFTFDTTVANYNAEAVALCNAGGMVYTATVDSVAVATTSVPVGYDSSDIEFTVVIPEFIATVFNEDGLDYIGTSETYMVTVELADWPCNTFPTATTDSSSSTIFFEEACDNPNIFLAPLTDEFITAITYTQEEYSYNFAEKFVDGDYCLDTAEIEFTCVSVIGPDGNDYVDKFCGGES